MVLNVYNRLIEFRYTPDVKSNKFMQIVDTPTYVRTYVVYVNLHKMYVFTQPLFICCTYT